MNEGFCRRLDTQGFKWNDKNNMKDEENALLKEFGLSEMELSKACEKRELHPGIAFGLGAFFVANVAILLSLPPVLRGKGKS